MKTPLTVALLGALTGCAVHPLPAVVGSVADTDRAACEHAVTRAENIAGWYALDEAHKRYPADPFKGAMGAAEARERIEALGWAVGLDCLIKRGYTPALNEHG